MKAKYRVQIGLMLSIEADMNEFTEDSITKQVDLKYTLLDLKEKGFNVESSGVTVMDTGVRIKN